MTRVENQCELPEGRRVLCLPPREYGGLVRERVGGVGREGER